MRLLIVDDNQNLLNDIAEAIKPFGFRIDTATNPLKALDKYRKQRYDAVLTDVRMPEMNGIVLMKKIMEINPDSSVVFMSAFITLEDAVATIDNHAFTFLGKPCNFEKLFTILEMIEAERRSRISSRKVPVMKTVYDSPVNKQAISQIS